MTTATEPSETATGTSAGDDARPVEIDEKKLASGPTVLQRLKELPPTVRSYLLSADLAAAHTRIFEQYGLAPDDRDVTYYSELQTFFGELPLADFPDRVWNRLSWDDDQEDKATQLVIDILGYVFLPAQAHLGDVAGLITSLGGDVKKYPEKQLEMRRLTFTEGAKEIAEAVVLADDGEDMRKRLAHIIESHLRQVRDAAETKEMLMKPKKTGGMELSEDVAAGIMALIASKTRMTAFAEIIEKAVEPAASEEASAPAKELSAIEIKKLYSGAPEEQEALAKRVERFRKVTEGDPMKMRDAFFQVLYPPDLRPVDPLYVVAGLIAMSDGDRLTEAVENDERYRAIVSDFLTSKGLETDLAAYQEDPTEPRFMNMLLQFLLRGIAGFEEKESARLGLRALNALKKQGYDRYADLVAFDMEKGEFRWKETITP